MCEGFDCTAKQIGVYLNTSNGNDSEMVLKTDVCYGHINSIEVAALCLLQKITNDNAWSSKTCLGKSSHI